MHHDKPLMLIEGRFIVNTIIKSLAIASVFAVSVIAPVALTGTTQAESRCSIETARPEAGKPVPNSKFTTQEGRMYIDVIVTGKDCVRHATLAAWEAPNGVDGRPYKEQVLASHMTKTIETGNRNQAKRTLSVQIPECYYQIDIMRGKKVMGRNGEIKFDADKHLGGVHGGTQACETPETPVTPETPETPTTPSTPATPETELTKTGPASAIAAFSGVSTLAAGVHYVMRRKFGL